MMNTINAGMVELVDTTDLKSVGLSRPGSSPGVRTNRMFSYLKKIAIDNEGVQGRFKLASAVVYKKYVIATGVNSYKTHPLMNGEGYKLGQVFLHAEIDAIKNALKLIDTEQLAQCDLYVVRVKRPNYKSKNWIYGLAKPCPGCTKAIAGFGIKNVYYSENEDESWTKFK
jgi:tRNA(Arg) A34 adenosine deaminase TadA